LLTGLSLEQDELFLAALCAVEASLFRAAHVLAWAGFIDYFHSYWLPNRQTALVAVQPKWQLSRVEKLA
jgi:hypothetical protein